MTTHKTKTGRILTDAEVDALADEVETTGYDVEEIKTRRRGRQRWARARPMSYPYVSIRS